LSFLRLPAPLLVVVENAPGMRMLSSAENEFRRLLVERLLFKLLPRLPTPRLEL
jgi:hypothetical protein